MERPHEVAGPSTLQSNESSPEVENASPVVRQHQKYVQDLEPDRWHGEKVN
jgi:hypothetical protein